MSEQPPSYDEQSPPPYSEGPVNKDIDKIELVISALKKRENVFLSGPGGTGKSFMIKEIYNRLSQEGYHIYKTASTGVSADSIGGTTLHHWAGVQLGKNSATSYYNYFRSNNALFLKWLDTQILIIDEISMIGASFFQKLADIGELVFQNSKPFGAITLLIVGDICQLPPVNDNYFFETEAYQKLNFKAMRLTHPWRFQGDAKFFEILSRVRVGEHTDEDVSILNTCVKRYQKEILNRKFLVSDIKPTRMFAKKVDVDEINMKELSQLPSDQYEYTCFDQLNKKDKKRSTAKIENFQTQMDKMVPVTIKLKKNAQVMLTYNLDTNIGLCNGSRGIVIECFDNEVLVQFKNGVTQMIRPNKWSFETETEVFERYQIPLILAWSNTIHKSQSSTLDYVIIDIGTSIFSANMAYVALSRCRSIDGLYIINLIKNKIYCDPKALEFEKYLIELSENWD